MEKSPNKIKAKETQQFSLQNQKQKKIGLFPNWFKTTQLKIRDLFFYKEKFVQGGNMKMA